MNLLKLNLS